MHPSPLTPLTLRSRRRWPIWALLVAGLGGCAAPGERAPDQPIETTGQAAAGDTIIDPNPTFIGIYRPANTGMATPTVFNQTESQIITEATNQRNADFEIRSLTTHVVNGQLLYDAVFWPHGAPGLPDQFPTYGLAFDAFNNQYADLTRRGWRLRALTTTLVGSTVRYTGIYERGSYDHTPGFNRTQAQFNDDWVFWRDQGRYLVFLAAVHVGGQVLYNGVYAPGTPVVPVTSLDSASFGAEFNNQWRAGRRLSWVSTYFDGATVRHNGLFGATGDAWISFGLPRAGFVDTQNTERSRGSLVWQIQTSHIEGLALNRLADSVKNGLSSWTVGSANTVAYQDLSFRGTSGRWRTSADPPRRDATTFDRGNSGSVTKTATAIAVLQLLNSRGLGVHTSIRDFLPRDWTPGNNMASVTFHQLLTHTSGFDRVNPQAFLDYDSLKATYASNLPNAGPFPSIYNNANFAIFRIIIPYLRGGFRDPGAADRPRALANAYMSCMNDRVFRVAGINPTTARPATVEPTRFYPLPAGNTPGADFGDLTLEVGGGFLEMSADDIALMLRRRADGTLLPSDWRDIMDQRGYGWDEIAFPVRHGTVRSKGGFVPCTTAGRDCAVNTMAVSFSNDVHLGVFINSVIKIDLLQTIATAYSNSWIPIN